MIKIHAAVAFACFLQCSHLSSGRSFDRKRKTVDLRCWWGAEFVVKRTLTSSHESLWSVAFVGLTRSRFLRSPSVTVPYECLDFPLRTSTPPRLFTINIGLPARTMSRVFVPDPRDPSCDRAADWPIVIIMIHYSECDSSHRCSIELTRWHPTSTPPNDFW